MADRDDRLLEHNYDGIQEYDNPLPGWWTALFWLTIVFAAGYWGYYQLLGMGENRY
ncbi:MAG: cytochrome C, partial [Deltaproteobacteria bacterium]|nr:cytochrome C [Deltaproteobacteria bacterium]